MSRCSAWSSTPSSSTSTNNATCLKTTSTVEFVSKTTNKLLKYVYARLFDVPFDVPYIFYSEMHEFLKILKLNFYNKQNISSYLGENMPLFILTPDMTPPPPPPHRMNHFVIIFEKYFFISFLYIY